MKKLMVFCLVLLLGLTECSDTGIYETFLPADRSGVGVTIQIAGGIAYLRSMGIEKTLGCEIVEMKNLKTGRLFRAIKFKDSKTDQAFYAEIVEVDSAGKVQALDVDFPFMGGIYKRKNAS